MSSESSSKSTTSDEEDTSSDATSKCVAAESLRMSSESSSKSTTSDEEDTSSDATSKCVANESTTHKERKQFAERHGKFIISMMTEFREHMIIGPAKPNKHDKFVFKKIPGWTGGLFVFYLVEKKDNTKLPIYVGETTLAFCDSFRAKHVQETVFKWFEKFKPELFDLYVVVCKLSNPQASFMKALFLDVFNFIRNSVHSDCPREILCYENTYTRVKSWEMIRRKWRYIKYDLKYVVMTVEYMKL